MTFHFDVVRLWQQPVDTLLTGSLSLLPLAPLAAVQPSDLPRVIDRLDARALLRSVRCIRESATCQAILEEARSEGESVGQIRGARRILERIGRAIDRVYLASNWHDLPRDDAGARLPSLSQE